MSADPRPPPDREGRSQFVLIIVVVIVLFLLALIALFFRSLWWKESGPPLPRGTELQQHGPVIAGTDRQDRCIDGMRWSVERS